MSSTDGSSDWGFGRKKKKLRPGDGHRLKPFRVWQGLTRSLFYAPLETSDGGAKVYAVNVNYFDWDDTADLYLDGVHYVHAELTAEFHVLGVSIEGVSSCYGLYS